MWLWSITEYWVADLVARIEKLSDYFLRPFILPGRRRLGLALALGLFASTGFESAAERER